MNKHERMKLVSDPGKYLNTFGNTIIYITHWVEGSRVFSDELSLILAGTVLDITVPAFQLKALGLHDRLDKDPVYLNT